MAKAQEKEDPNLMLFHTKVIYNYSFQPDSTKDIKKELMTELLVNDTIAVFQTQRKSAADSNVYAQEGYSGLISIYGGEIVPHNFRIIQGKETILTLESLNGLNLELNNEVYLYEEYVDQLNWEIQEEVSVIHDISVQKATLTWGGRNWIVWFAPDIPIPHGPYKFCGLPGLIVQAADDKNMFFLDLISIKHQNSQLPIEPRSDLKYVRTTKNDFYQKRKHFRENMYEIILAEGIPPNEETKNNFKKLNEEDNNHIEKY